MYLFKIEGSTQIPKIPSPGPAGEAMELGDWLEVVCDFDSRKARGGRDDERMDGGD